MNLLKALGIIGVMLLSACGPTPINKKNGQNEDEVALNQASDPFAYANGDDGIETITNVGGGSPIDDGDEPDEDDFFDLDDSMPNMPSGSSFGESEFDGPIFLPYAAVNDPQARDMFVSSITRMGNDIVVRVRFNSPVPFLFMNIKDALTVVAEGRDQVTNQLIRYRMPSVIGSIRFAENSFFDFVFRGQDFDNKLANLGDPLRFTDFRTIYAIADPKNLIPEIDELNNFRIFYK